MRIAYVCADPGIPVFGNKGGSVHVQEVARALGRTGARVDLFAAALGGTPPPDLEEVDVVEVPIGPGGASARERACLDANGRLTAALGERGPFDLVYERQSLFGFAGMEFARESGIPGLLEVNAPLVLEQETYRKLVNRAAAEEAGRRAFSAASAILAVSRNLAARLDREPAARERVHEVPNGVDPARFATGVAPARLKTPGELVVGFVGSFKPWHGLSVLADAFADFSAREPRARLLVVGDGAGREDLQSEIGARGLGAKAFFAGAVPPAEVPRWLRSMDVAAAPYPGLADFYFSPLKVYEYMAAGLAVVASRVGQIAEAIDDCRTGLLCAPGDAGAFATAFETLARDETLRARLGRAAREEILRNHTWASVAGRILEIAERVAAPSTPERRA